MGAFMRQQTVDRMQGFSRVVRVTTMVFTLSAIVGTMAIYMFWSLTAGSGSNVTALSVAQTGCNDTNNYCAPADSSQLREAIRRQQALGRSCSSLPVLSDVVLFQRSKDLKVDALSFDEALRASATKSGWVQRYCN